MTILPIQFRTKLNKAEYSHLSTDEILNRVEKYLENKGYGYISRSGDNITFHKIDLIKGLGETSLVGGGIVKVNNKKNNFVVVNGNWTTFLSFIPFIVLLILSESRFSTLNQDDVDMIKNALLILFVALISLRFLGHYYFKQKIKEVLK